jgi:outer membrane receptor for monomeric catechols
MAYMMSGNSIATCSGVGGGGLTNQQLGAVFLLVESSFSYLSWYIKIAPYGADLFTITKLC